MIHSWSPVLVIVSAIAASGLADTAWCQTTHVVNPGDTWDDVHETTRPGDSIRLLAGDHKPAILQRLHGTPEQPITITGEGAETRITASFHGLRLLDARHIVIENLTVRDATINGLDVRRSEHVRVRGVAIERNGTSGLRHAMQFSSSSHVVVEDSTATGWGGAAVDAVNVDGLRVERCVFTGPRDGESRAGIQLRGGSSDVVVRDCTFDVGAIQMIAIGGPTTAEEAALCYAYDAEPGSLTAASNVHITHNVIRGGWIGLSLGRCREVVIEHNTVINPTHYVLAVTDDPTYDPRVGPSQDWAFRENIFTWTPPLPDTIRVWPGVDPTFLSFEENVWWAGSAEATSVDLPGTIVFEQLLADPGLDADGLATTDGMTRYGATPNKNSTKSVVAPTDP